MSASDDCRIKLWGLVEYPQAEVDSTKPKRVDYDPATNTSFGALASSGIIQGRLANNSHQEPESSSDDFESSNEEVDEDNEDEEGWGG